MEKEKQQVVRELHRNARKNFKRRRVIVKNIHDLIQIDLIDMKKYAKFNKGYTFILVAINCFTKFAWAESLKNKSGPEVLKTIKKLLKIIPKFDNLQSDEGREFFNKDFNELMKNHNINHYKTYSFEKACIAERFIRTIKTWIWQHFSLSGKYNWINNLQDLIKKYNNKIHRTIGMKPKDVGKKDEKRLLNTVFKESKISDRLKFHVGDFVRVSKFKHIFTKGYTPNWGTEVFEIFKVRPGSPPTYYLQDSNKEKLQGAFYSEELQKVRYPDVYLVEKILKRRGKKLYVRWLGLPESMDSWIET